jgi:DNA-binding CsgD family transcriptional regulator
MASERDGRANSLDEPPSDLTPRDHEVAALISQGLSNQDIARQLTLTPGTVANHVAHILAKTGARSRVQVAVSLARSNGNRTAHPSARVAHALAAARPTDACGALQRATQVLASFFGADASDAFVYDAGGKTLVVLGSSQTPLAERQRALDLHPCPSPTAVGSPGSLSSNRPFAAGQLKTTPSNWSASAATWGCGPRWPFRLPYPTNVEVFW